MSLHRLFNFAMALCIATILSCGHLLDGPNDTQAAQDSARSHQDAKKAAKAEQLRANAAKVAGVSL